MRGSPIDPHRWRRLKILLEHAIELDAGKRGEYLAGLDSADADLRPDLERMLKEHTAREAQFIHNAESFGLPALSAAVSTEADKLDRTGERIGRYRLLRLLGVGGMGSVYLAEREDGGFRQRVAIKIVEGVVGSMRERFDRERQIIARLRHPCIASLYDGGETEDALYYTMELIEGESIADYLQKETGTVEERVRLLLQVATALRYAHQNLVVHRDIKPSNILVTADGKVKLLDFGIAKLLTSDAEFAMTKAPLGPMTPGYAAPEQFRGDPISVATDIFQFGTLCYRMLTGHWPYRVDPKDEFACMKAVSEDEPVSLSLLPARAESEKAYPMRRRSWALGRSLTGDLDAILRKALKKDPERRYPSMDAMIADLEAFLERRPVSVRRAGTAYFVWRWIARRPYVSAGAALVVAALLLSTAIAVRQTFSARKETTRAQNEATHANDISNFLVSLFQVADPGVNRGERLNADEVLQRGVERIRDEFANKPEERARLQAVIGEVYGAIGDWARAEPSLEEAVHALRTLPNADTVELGHDLRVLGSLADTLKQDLNGSMVLLSEAKVILAKAKGPKAAEERALASAALGSTLTKLGRFDAAGDELKNAMATADTARVSQGAVGAVIYHDRGILLRDTGHFREAKVELEHAVSIARVELGDDHSETLQSKTALGTVMMDLGQWAEAHDTVADVAESERQLLGESNVAYGESLRLLGGVDRELGKLAEAQAHFTQADEIFRSAPDEN